MAKQMIGDLKEGDRVRSYFLVREKAKLLTRTDKVYLSVDLMDRSGTINGKVWDNAEKAYKCFDKGDVVGVRGLVDSYRGRLQMKIVDIRPADERDEGTLDMADILPRTPKDPDAMWARIGETIETVEDNRIRGLLEGIFNDVKIGPAFRNSTAARDMHHNYIGGLLEHTLSVTAIADFLCGHYGADINRDLVIAGALLHDVGKIEEIDSSRDFNYTVAGSLKGHVVIGLEIVREFAAKTADFPAETLLLIEHLIASHQGEKEWASPVEPKIPEAQIVHMADLTDARMFQFLRAIREDKNEDDPFTPKVYPLERSLLKISDPEELKKWMR